MRLKDKVAIITGGGAGIGRAGVEAFLREGARVMVAEINPNFVARMTSELSGRGETWEAVQTDVTQIESVEATIDATTRKFGRLDILYNNAGASSLKDGTVVTAEIEGFWDAIRLNLFGTWLMCRCAIPEIIKGGGGVVINTTSCAGLAAAPGVDCYSAAKAGVIALTKSMALSFGEQRVRVNAIAPTTTLTERARSLDASRSRVHDGLPMLRRNLFGHALPADIANAAVFLASEEAARITGHTLPVDSGWLL